MLETKAEHEYTEVFIEDMLPRGSRRRTLFRLHLDLNRGGVEWEMLAGFNARIIAKEQMPEPFGVTAVIGIRGNNGAAMLFRCPLSWLTSGDPHDARRFQRELMKLKGFTASGSFISPGALAPTIRAIVALSEEGMPMPPDLGELDAAANMDAPEALDGLTHLDRPEPSPDALDDFWNEGF